MSEDRVIRIDGHQLAEWGPKTTEMMKSCLATVVGEKTGKTMVWRSEFNRDAIVLVAEDEDRKRAPVEAYGRIDLWPGHLVIQVLPGQRDRAIRDLLTAIDYLRVGPDVPFVQFAEVEKVKA